MRDLMIRPSHVSLMHFCPTCECVNAYAGRHRVEFIFLYDQIAEDSAKNESFSEGKRWETSQINEWKPTIIISLVIIIIILYMG